MLSERGSIAARIDARIVRDDKEQSSDKTRILAQLGFGLAVVYVLFLSLWFWITRGRIARGRVVRF